jgi:hypothetical protein
MELLSCSGQVNILIILGIWLWCPRKRPRTYPTEIQLLSLPTGDPTLRKRPYSIVERDTGVDILDLHLDPTQDLLVLSESM